MSGSSGVGAGADRDGVPRDELGDACRPSAVTVTRLTPVSRPWPRSSVDAGARRPTRPGTRRPSRGRCVSRRREHRRDVERAGDGLLRAIRRRCAARSARAAAQQRLRRHARPVRALAADQLALDEDGGQAALHGAVGDVLADRAGADDDDVVRGRSFALLQHDRAAPAVVDAVMPRDEVVHVLDEVRRPSPARRRSRCAPRARRFRDRWRCDRRF